MILFIFRIYKFNLIFLLLVLPTLITAQTDILDKANELHKQGKAGQSKMYYRQWLENNSNSKNLIKVLDSYLSAEQNLKDQIHLLKFLLLKIENEAEKIFVLKQLSSRLDITGDSNEGAAIYKKLYSIVKDENRYSYLLSSAFLNYDSGNLSQVIEDCQLVLKESSNKLIKSKAANLLAVSLFQSGGKEKALSYYKSIITEFKNSDYLPVILLTYYELLLEQKENTEAEKIFKYFQTNLSHTAEYEILIQWKEKNKTDRIKSYPNPSSYYLSLYEIDDNPENVIVDKQENKDEETTQPPIVKYIQTGSFIDKENAEYMVKGLMENGFNAKIVDKNIHNKVYYRVLVSIPEPDKNINEFLIQLKDAGYEGILYYPN